MFKPGLKFSSSLYQGKHHLIVLMVHIELEMPANKNTESVTPNHKLNLKKKIHEKYFYDNN